MSLMPEVLIVEDEPKLAALLADYLRAAGFNPQTVDNGLDVEAAVADRRPAMVLLDLMLPGKDGLDICRDLRRGSDIPIIIITARIEEIDRILGLELGADDYICKPFSPREVVARVRAVLRRHAERESIDTGGEIKPVPGLSIDGVLLRVELDGNRLDLTPVELRLLETLATQPGKIFARAALIESIYGAGHPIADRTIDSHVRNLRRKLAEAAPQRELLHSVYGVGYRLEDGAPPEPDAWRSK